MSPRALIVGTVARSLALQSPVQWDELTDRDFELTFASRFDGWEGRLAHRGQVERVPFTRHPRSAFSPAVRGALARLLAERWDLVQVQSPVAAAAVRLLAPASRSWPLVYIAHGLHFHRDGRALQNLAYRTTESYLARRTDAMAVVAREDWEAVHGAGMDRHTRVHWLPGGGVDVDRFASARPRPVFAGPSPVALFCGDLNPNKDPATAVAAISEVRRRGHDWRLVVVGEGDTGLVTDGAGAEATWLAHIAISDDVAGLLKASTVLLAPSYREGLPRVVVEALAGGVPTVARSNRGTRELLDDGYGVVLPSRADASDFADALVRFDRSALPSGAAMETRARNYTDGAVRSAYARLLDDVGVRSGRVAA